jgi:hypothetical protein
MRLISALEARNITKEALNKEKENRDELREKLYEKFLDIAKNKILQRAQEGYSCAYIVRSKDIVKERLYLPEHYGSELENEGYEVFEDVFNNYPGLILISW